jgi:biotin synthase
MPQKSMFEQWFINARKREWEKADIVRLLSASSSEEELIFAAAREERARYFGNKCFLRAVVEFANRCICNCHYCGMRRDSGEAGRYLLGSEEILEIAARVYEMKIPTIFLQSAEDKEYEVSWLANIIRQIRVRYNLRVLLCIGKLTDDELVLLRDAGATRMIIKHETADPELFKRYKPDLSIDVRIEDLKRARKAGFEIGSGPLLGLPGQTLESLADDILLMQSLGVKMSSVSIFMPALNTPLESAPSGDVMLGCRFIAAMRLVLHDTLIPSTSTFERAFPGEGQVRGLNAGANVITVNMTPEERKNAYQLYSERYYVRYEHALSCIKRAGLESAAE